MKLLVVVDMQNDFVTGALKNEEAVKIIPAIIRKIEKAEKSGDMVVFTHDTHGENYMNTQEGKKLPVVHCVRGTWGWNIIPELSAYENGKRVFEKPTFGSERLAEFVRESGFEDIELVGVCTDICVISNAMLLKAAVPEANITVDGSCCAGVTPASHQNALNAMKMCQIDVI